MVKVARKKSIQPRPINGPKKRESKKAQGLPRELATNPYALARLDPFNPGCTGAKIPDFDNNNSAALSVQFELSLNSDNLGYLGMVFPFTTANSHTTCNMSGGAWLFNGGVNAIPEHAANFSGWNEAIGLRVVGAGLKLDTNLNANNADGRLFIIPMSTAEMRVWRADQVNRSYTTAELTRRKGVVRKSLSDLASDPFGMGFNSTYLDPSCQTYVDPQYDYLSASYNGPFPNQMGCVLICEGMPFSRACIEVTVILHLEFIPGKSFSYLTNGAEPCNMKLLETVNNIAEKTPRVIQKLGDIGGHLMSAFSTGVKVAGVMGLL